MRDIDLLQSDWEGRAVDGMRLAFLRSFRLRIGPAGAQLAECAWSAWRAGLVNGLGASGAEAAALRVGQAFLRTHSRGLSRAWITDTALGQALRRAVRRACDVG